MTGGLLAPAFVGIRLPLDANIAVGFLLTVLFIGAGTLRAGPVGVATAGGAGPLLLSALLAEAGLCWYGRSGLCHGYRSLMSQRPSPS